MSINKSYSPKDIEQKWYDYWIEIGAFKPMNKKPKFSIIAPPPNVTGILHMGHVLNNTIQDVIIRYYRMKGYSTVWVPGLDHAGIATETKVEEKLQKDGKSKKELGRDKFIQNVWEWKDKYGNIIFKQFEKLGLSLDWSRAKFTMDPEEQEAVKECFVRLYKEGLIYKGSYMINWSSLSKTALSDEEVDYEEIYKDFYYISYPLETEGEILIATTRPETIPADTAIAVNPNDERYKNLIGKRAYVPIVNRLIPIIADEEVKIDFGTGALKITPAHSFIDFEIGKRHKIETINILDEEGKIINVKGYEGLEREEAKNKILKELKLQNLVRKQEKIKSLTGFCNRTRDIIEPRVSNQWFLKMGPLAKKAIEAVKENEIELLPQRWVKVYYNWLENIKDWCISRQIWWGHRIPAYYKEGSLEPIVSREDLTAQGYKREEDVLDTWFSSWLWPFLVFGWPNKTEDLDKYFPTDVLVTGSEIIFFWVARMIMSSYKFLDKKPFSKVLFHGIVRDELGRKMSKSLGNSPDPLDIIEKYGADSLRFGMMYNNTLGADLYYSEEWLDLAKNFCNKIWNSAKFINIKSQGFEYKKFNDNNLSLEDLWILSKLNNVIEKVNSNIESLNLEFAAKDLYNFFWKDLCDWYLEIVKVNESPISISVLNYTFEKCLKILHPFIPFITEEIWHSLPFRENVKSISISDFPIKEDKYINLKLEGEVEEIFEIIRKVRNIRVENNIFNSKPIDVIIKSKKDNIEKFEKVIKKMLNINNLTISYIEVEKPKIYALEVTENYEIYVLLEGLLDLEKEISNLNKDILNTEKEYEKIVTKLSNKEFLLKAPKHILERDERIKREYEDKLKALKEKIESLKN